MLDDKTLQGLKTFLKVAGDAQKRAGWNKKPRMPVWAKKCASLLLMVSELSEATEGIRRNKKDDHLPEFMSEEVELGDAVIRIFAHAATYKLDLVGAINAKMKYNETRADHKVENRNKKGGKVF